MKYKYVKKKYAMGQQIEIPEDAVSIQTIDISAITEGDIIKGRIVNKTYQITGVK